MLHHTPSIRALTAMVIHAGCLDSNTLEHLCTEQTLNEIMRL